MSIRFSLVLAGSMLLVTGCGPASVPREALVPVGGTLLVDGKPLDGVVLTFIPAEKKNRTGGSGTTDASGNFTITDLDQKEPGLPVGKYLVACSRMRLADGSPAPELKPGEEPDPKKIRVETFPQSLTVPNPNDLSKQVDIPKEGNTKLELKLSTKG